MMNRLRNTLSKIHFFSIIFNERAKLIIMEALLVFIIAIGIVILQIIMIAKFFQIAADVRDIKNIQSRRMTENTTKTDNISIDSNPNYSLNGEDVTFRDGLTGKIKIYPGYSECSIITEDGYELLYNNREYAITALHDYLKNHIESQNGLYTKRKYKS